MKGSGGTEGGLGTFVVGFALAALAVHLFFDSVMATTGAGLFSGLMGGGGGHGFWQTTSMGIIFLPFFIGVLALFVDSKQRWAWWLMGLGLAILAIEILSRVRFILHMKTTHLLGLFILFAAGAGLMIRSYRDRRKAGETEEPEAE